ncbi:hypothetical protein PG989_004200 [Apiospora arundinis]
MASGRARDPGVVKLNRTILELRAALVLSKAKSRLASRTGPKAMPRLPMSQLNILCQTLCRIRMGRRPRRVTAVIGPLFPIQSPSMEITTSAPMPYQ